MVPRLNCCTTPDGLEPGILSVHDGGKKPNISRLGPVFLLREKKKKKSRQGYDICEVKGRTLDGAEQQEEKSALFGMRCTEY